MAPYSKKSRLTPMEKLEYEGQQTVYNGQVVSLAQAIAMRARDNRKKKQQERKKRNEFHKSDVFPEILTMIEKIFKHRNLKSFSAFITNGSIIWSKDYKNLSIIYPRFDNHFISYRSQYNKVSETYETLSQLLKRNKCNHSFIGVAEKFGYEMMELLDRLSDLADYITRNSILSNPCYINKEIIIGSTDGRRLGLKQILQNSTNSISKTREKLIELQRELINAYKTLYIL